MRYLARLAYDGSQYHGWQKQIGQVSVQELIEHRLSTLLARPIPVVGCGRTDTGVHASDYVIHFDYQHELPDNLQYKLNSFLPDDIVFYEIRQTHEDFHARFDAVRRTYRYYVSTAKSVFDRDYSFRYSGPVDLEQLTGVSELLSQFKDFAPFCKSNSGLDNFVCHIYDMKWYWQSEYKLVFEVSANRFLRGMIRLLVGAHLNVCRGKLSLDELKKSMDEQTVLKQAWSVPAHALFLSKIEYDIEESDTLN